MTYELLESDGLVTSHISSHETRADAVNALNRRVGAHLKEYHYTCVESPRSEVDKGTHRTSLRWGEFHNEGVNIWIWENDGSGW